MSGGRPRIEERVGRALARGDLRQRDEVCSLDIVTALGLVGIRERLADAVYRLKAANQPSAYGDALAGVYGLARSMDARLHWRLKRNRLHLMAKRVLDYWLCDSCRACSGIGYLVVSGTPMLSDRVCLSCHGTRKTVMPWLRKLPRKPEKKKDGERWRKLCRLLNDSMARHRLLLVALETSERSIGEQVMARLRRPA